MFQYSMLSARPGARRLALAGALSQLAWGGVALAIVLAIGSGGRPLSAAGVAAAALSLGAALLAPLRGRLVDRRGGGALLLLGLASSLALLGLAAQCAAGGALAVLVGLAFLAGAAAPPVMAAARAIWPAVAGPELRRTGHAVNAMVGDLGAALGPALAGASALALGAPGSVALLALGPLAGSALIALGGLADLRVGPSGAPAAPSEGGSVPQGLVTLALTAGAVAVSLGAAEICAPAIARGEGQVELAALPLTALAGTSFLTVLVLGREGRRAAPQLFLGGCGLLATALALCVAAPALLPFTAVLLAAGIGFGMFNLALLELLDHVMPPERATEALTWVTSAEVAGLAAGNALAGFLADRSLRAALLVVALAPALGALIAWIGRGALEPQGPSTRAAYSLVNARPGSSSSRAAAKSSQHG